MKDFGKNSNILKKSIVVRAVSKPIGGMTFDKIDRDIIYATSKINNTNALIVHLSMVNPICILDLSKCINAKTAASIEIPRITDEDASEYLSTGALLINCEKFSNTGRSYNISNTGANDMIYTFTLTKKPSKSFDIIGVIHSVGSKDVPLCIFIDADETSVKVNANERSSYVGTPGSSDMLLSTSPKLTGNIKLVIDSDDKLYLDTFKATHLLNNNNFRKQEVSYQGSYPIDVKNVFRKLPKGEIFKWPADSCNPRKTYDAFNMQLPSMYHYGAESNSDPLYKEDLKILAPLKINNILPDFFAIFRVDSVCNGNDMSIANLDTAAMNDFIANGKIVKLFDLRLNTAAGHYIRSYADSIKNERFPIYLQFLEQDSRTAKDDYNYMKGKNSFTGISLAKGVIVNALETSYFSDKIISDSSSTHFDYINFLTSGFERNNILYPSILNLEFMFNDPDIANFTMARYFGLYLKMNDVKAFAGSLKHPNMLLPELLNVDGTIDTESQPLLDNILESANYKNRIFFGVSSNNTRRISSRKDLAEYMQEVTNQPGEAVLKVPARKVSLEKQMSFITLNFIDPVKYGEHFRFCIKDHVITRTNEKKDIVLEIIASNDKTLLECKDFISPEVVINKRDNNSIIDDKLKFRSDKDLAKTDYLVDINTSTSNIWEKWPADSSNYDISQSSIYTGLPVIDLDSSTGITLPRPKSDFGYINDLLRLSTDEDYNNGVEDNRLSGKDGLMAFNAWNPETKYIKSINEEAITEYPTVARLSFYTQDVENPEIPATVEEQIERIAACIRKFNYTIAVTAKNSNSLGIVSTEKCIYFQHIAASILDIDIAKSNDFEIDYTRDYIDDTIKYFSDPEVQKMKLLNFNVSDYSKNTVMFAPLDYELLGYRLSNIVKFAAISPKSYAYEIMYSKLIPYNRTLLIKSRFGYFPMASAAFDHGYVYASNALFGNEIAHLELDTKSFSSIQSPFDLSKQIVFSEEPASMVNNEVSIFKSAGFSINLMGIHPVKAFHGYVNIIQDKKSSNMKSLIFANGTKAYIGTEENDLKRGIIYKLKKGSFIEANVSVNTPFIITANKIYYNAATAENSTGFDISKCLTCSGDTEIVEVASSYYDIVNDVKKMPSIVENDLYLDKKNKDVSLTAVPPAYNLIHSFESIGTYQDNIKEIDLKSLNDISVEAKTSGIIDSLELKTAASIESACNDRTYLDEAISSNNIVYHLLSQSFQNASNAKSYYNTFTNKLEFIVNGVKVNISLSSNEYRSIISLREYNRYDVYVVANNASYKKSRIIISTKEKAILICLNNFSCGQDDCSLPIGLTKINWQGPSTEANTIGYLIKPYKAALNFDKAFGNSNYLVIPKESSMKYDPIDNENIVSLQYNEAGSNDNFYGYFKWDSYAKDYADHIKINYMNSGVSRIISLNSLQGIDGVKSGVSNNTIGFSNDSTQLTSSYTAGVIGYKDFSKKPADTKRSFTSRLADSFNKLVNFDLIIVDDISKVYDISNDFRLIIINATCPERIKFNSGYFDLMLDDIIEFEDYEVPELRSMLGTGFMRGNTRIYKVHKLKSQIQNKVLSSSAEQKTMKQNFFIKTNASVMSSDWDPRFFRSYNDESNFLYQNGYAIGVDSKTFFGSRCINIKSEDIILDNWNFSMSSASKNMQISKYNTKSTHSQTLSITLNVTENFISKISNTPAFYSNWIREIGKVDNSWLTNYIKNIILKFYSIDDTCKLTVYSKTLNADNPATKFPFVYSKPADFETVWKEESNIYTEFKSSNNNLELTLEVPANENKIYYPVITIKKYTI